MVDSCYLNSSRCTNNGKCVLDIVLNATYCQCDECHEGILCENVSLKYKQIGKAYVFFIAYIIVFCLSILNNGPVLELYIRSKRIRNTNCGVYLIVYSILSVLSIIFLLVHEAVEYYALQLINNDQYKILNCYIDKIGYNILAGSCRLLSSCIALERGFIICLEGKMNANRWRSTVSIIVIFVSCVSVSTPMLVHKCRWDKFPGLVFVREFFSWSPVVVAVVVYLLATILVLISFTRRIRRYGMENGSYIKTFLKLLYTHLFIFLPPIAYVSSEIPWTIVYRTKTPGTVYYDCDLPIGTYIIRASAEVLTKVPFAVTWLLFVYPSRVYMTEFYLYTWSGQCLAKMFLLFKSSKHK